MLTENFSRFQKKLKIDKMYTAWNLEFFINYYFYFWNSWNLVTDSTVRLIIVTITIIRLPDCCLSACQQAVVGIYELMNPINIPTGSNRRFYLPPPPAGVPGNFIYRSVWIRDFIPVAFWWVTSSQTDRRRNDSLCWHIRTNRVPNIRIYSEKFSLSEYSAYSDTLNPRI